MILPEDFNGNSEDFKNFEIRKDDIWIATYPKSGTTWVQEIVYCILNGWNYDREKTGKLDERIPFFEFIYPGLKAIEKMNSPRVIKTHLPIQYLPNEIEKKCKVAFNYFEKIN